MGMPPTPRWRPTARLLVFDPRGRLLLFRFARGNGLASWLTPGGGIRPGESVAEAAVRELAEETGHVVTQESLGPVVATRAGLARSWTSDRLIFAADTFFMVRVAHSAVRTDGHEEAERRLISAHHWWTADELGSTGEDISPPGLSELAAGLLAGGGPARPRRLPW
jgi:8-oxo-dGTP pyrophosphatase MutT (NUDIX family)